VFMKLPSLRRPCPSGIETMIDPYEIDRQFRAEYRRSRLLLSEKLLPRLRGLRLSVQKGHTSDQALDHVLMTSTWIFLLSSMIAGIGVLLLDLMSEKDTIVYIEECSTMARSTSATEHLKVPRFYAIWIYVMIFSFASGVVSLTWFSALNVLNR